MVARSVVIDLLIRVVAFAFSFAVVFNLFSWLPNFVVAFLYVTPIRVRILLSVIVFWAALRRQLRWALSLFASKRTVLVL